TDHPITETYIDESEGTRKVKIKDIIERRCCRCHSAGAGGGPSDFPLEDYDALRNYSEVETVGGGMSLTKLAQTTHVHLLGFAMLYSLTGLIMSFTSFPFWFRVVLAPFTLVAQLLDISCWWLGRLDPLFAKTIILTGSLVGLGLFLQIVLSLFNL